MTKNIWGPGFESQLRTIVHNQISEFRNPDMVKTLIMKYGLLAILDIFTVLKKLRRVAS